MERRWLAGLVVVLVVLMSGFPARAATVTMSKVPGLDRVKALAAAGGNYVALRADGTVWTWDDDADGVAAMKPQKIDVSCPVRAISPGTDRLAMLCANGTVWMAGFGISEPGVQRAIQAPGLSAVKAVSLGRTGLVSVRSDGTVWISEMAINTKGTGAAGRVGDLSGVIAVAAGITDFMAIHADGSASRMAINTKGTGATRVMAPGSVRSVAVCGPDDDCDDADPYIFTAADGKLISWSVGADGTERRVVLADVDMDGDLDIAAGHGRLLSATAAGDARMAMLSADGAATATDLGKPGPALKRVAAGGRYDMGLAADGTVWMWEAPSLITQVPGLAEIEAIASGGQWHLALAADGKLFCWGDNDTKRTHVIPHVFEVRGIAAAADYFVTVNSDGTIASGRCPAPGAAAAEPIIHRDIAARGVSAGRGHVILIKFDGRVEAAEIAIDEAGVHFSAFRAIPGIDGAVQAAAGASGYLVLRADGTVWGGRWGSAPTPVRQATGARAVSASDTNFAVLLGNGSVLGIAIDEAGVHIWGDPHVSEADGIAAGGTGVVVAAADGTAATFSRTVGAGQISDILEVVAVSAGDREKLALMADGTVWSWR